MQKGVLPLPPLVMLPMLITLQGARQALCAAFFLRIL
jgi:hypothetical protein